MAIGEHLSTLVTLCHGDIGPDIHPMTHNDYHVCLDVPVMGEGLMNVNGHRCYYCDSESDSE